MDHAAQHYVLKIQYQEWGKDIIIGETTWYCIGSFFLLTMMKYFERGGKTPQHQGSTL